MAERIMRSYDPMAYHVNNVGDFNRNVVVAFKNGDTNTLEALQHSESKMDFDVFICVSEGYHAFLLLSPNPDTSTYQKSDPLNQRPEMSPKPEDIPTVLLVHQLELCFEDAKAKMYRIRWKIDTFVNVSSRIKRAYFIGHYSGLSNTAIQLAGLRASPKSYSVLLDDCVEFAKKVCTEMLAFATNRQFLENEVKKQIRLATISGFTAEQLSREIQSSAYTVNSLITSFDLSSGFFRGRMKVFLIILVAILFLVYPFIVFFFLRNYFK